jgi:hypothetical protein
VQRITQRRHEITQIVKDRQAEIDFLLAEDKTLANLLLGQPTLEPPAQSVGKAPGRPRGKRKAAQGTDDALKGSTGTPEAGKDTHKQPDTPAGVETTMRLCPGCGTLQSGKFFRSDGRLVCKTCFAKANGTAIIEEQVSSTREPEL